MRLQAVKDRRSGGWWWMELKRHMNLVRITHTSIPTCQTVTNFRARTAHWRAKCLRSGEPPGLQPGPVWLWRSFLHSGICTLYFNQSVSQQWKLTLYLSNHPWPFTVGVIHTKRTSVFANANANKMSWCEFSWLYFICINKTVTKIDNKISQKH